MFFLGYWKITKIEREYHDRWMDLPSDDPNHLEYNEYKEQAKKAVGPVVAKYVKDFIDVANKTIIKNKKIFKKSLINSKHNKRTAWWNELLVYDTKIIDMFVMQRVLDNSVLAHFYNNDSVIILLHLGFLFLSK